MATTFGVLDYCIFIGLLVISALIGVYYILKERWQTKHATADDILMGGREMGIFPVAMSLIASYMSAITVLGIPTEIYLFGTGYWMVGFAGLLTYPVTCHIFLPFFHDMGLSSAYQYLELRFNRSARYLASVIFTIEMLLYMAVVLYAPSLALNQVTGLSLWVSILTVGVVVTFYTSLGGLRAVLWTDTFQTCVVIGGLVTIIITGSQRLGGFASVWHDAELGKRINLFNLDPSPFTRITVWGAVFGSFIGQLTIYAANQTMLQRYMAIKNVRNSQIALYISLPATILLISLVCMSGLVIYATYRNCDPLLNGEIISRDQLLPYLVMDTFGHLHGAPGLFVACIFAAALSSVSSCLNALSITILEDLVKPTLESCNCFLSTQAEATLAKLLGIFGGGTIIALAFLTSVLGNTVLQIMITALGMAGGPLLGLFLLGMFFPCCNAKGAITATVISTFVTFWIAIGAFVTHAPQPELPLSTTACPGGNETVTLTLSDLVYTANVSQVRAVSRLQSVIPMVPNCLRLCLYCYRDLHQLVHMGTCLESAVKEMLHRERHGCVEIRTALQLFPQFTTISSLSNLAHGPVTNDIKIRETLTRMQYGAKSSLIPMPTLFNEELSSMRDGAWTDDSRSLIADMPTFHTIKNQLYSAGRSTFSVMPSSRRTNIIPDEYTTTDAGEPFVIINDGDDNKILGMTTTSNIERLCAADTIYGDGTLHAMVAGQMFPLVFILLRSKTKETYSRAFSLLIAAIFSGWQSGGVEKRFVYPLSWCYDSTEGILKDGFTEKEAEAIFKRKYKEQSHETARLIPSDIRSMGNALPDIDGAY